VEGQLFRPNVGESLGHEDANFGAIIDADEVLLRVIESQLFGDLEKTGFPCNKDESIFAGNCCMPEFDSGESRG